MNYKDINTIRQIDNISILGVWHFVNKSQNFYGDLKYIDHQWELTLNISNLKFSSNIKRGFMDIVKIVVEINIFLIN